MIDLYEALEMGARMRSDWQVEREGTGGRDMDWAVERRLGLDRRFPEEISQFLRYLGAAAIHQVNLFQPVKALV
jgi:hypothetical protein